MGFGEELLYEFCSLVPTILKVAAVVVFRFFTVTVTGALANAAVVAKNETVASEIRRFMMALVD